ncbi:uroporphyrinogen-III C-methyltransferase [Cupriavidus sp. BIC8F]|uniref:uroporphyrinogen-III C-methyltransferase n=1 Tax=Cupriavidus sp. BIC8F TaxID=3079014 RepID=UPI002916EB28|nr:uroporphyrinogen-III C-methyltransferase [Cupriavidus sp. BIC8F]
MSRAWLIGAGPGDVELLTIKAVRALAAADVVLIDALVNPDVLQFVRPDARVLHVGKRGGHASTPQADIIATMLTHLQARRSVARLKGGDPFVFGRGGEELLALQNVGIPVEVIHGITAGVAAPAAIGIPITHRGLSQGAIFVTGHSAGDEEPDWHALASTGLTLVIYMGMHRLATIIDALLQGGMAPDTPSAAIQSATLPSQRHVAAPLAQLPSAIADAGLKPPTIVVIGDVTSLAAVPGVSPDIAAPTPTLTLGIGCRSGVTVDQIRSAALVALGGRPLQAIRCVATIEAKAQESALKTFCVENDLPLVTFSVAEVRDCLDAQPTLARSTAVQDHLGVPGVCEPCALLAAPGGTLLVPKLMLDGVTVAIATYPSTPPAPTPL